MVAVGWWLGSPLFLDRAVDEAFPTSAAETSPATTGTVPDPMDQSSQAERDTQNTQPDPTTVESGPVTLFTSEFQGADDFHQGQGSATVYDVGGGKLVLRLTEFEVTNGPDLRVTLYDGAGYLDLGPLKGNIGDQNYDVPDGIDLTSYQAVVIWCRAFDVVFASATL